MTSDLTGGERIDLGHGHVLHFVPWAPDRSRAHWAVPDDPRAGAHIEHPRADNGEPCQAGAYIGLNRYVNATTWDVLKAEPLTLSPSIQCGRCGDHGWIQEGKWVPV